MNLKQENNNFQKLERPPTTNPLELEVYFQEMKHSFDGVLTITDPEQRQRAIEREANNLNVAPGYYRRRLEAYALEKQGSIIKQTIVKSAFLLDTKLGDFARWLESLSLIKLAALLSEGALLFAVISYLFSIPYRRQQHIEEAREIIIKRVGQEYSDGRIEALERLNHLCANNSGLHAPKAQMSGIKLNRCYRFEMSANALLTWPPLLILSGMDLSHSNLEGANLASANLEGVNLQRSNLAGANLEGANLKGANLEGANLKGANLNYANLEGANLEGGTLNNSSLNNAYLKSANLSRAMLANAKAIWSNFNKANFYRADLEGANFNRANLEGADLYKANLQNSSFRFADLGGKTNLREANLLGANLQGAIFATKYQLKRAKNWQDAILSPNWEKKIVPDRLPRLKIGLIKPMFRETIFDAYELGMRRAANRRVEIWGIPSEAGVENEAETIREAIDLGIDAILLVPEDPIKSIPAIREARDAGIVVITIDFCFDRDLARRLVFACYNTDSFKMGYDSGVFLSKWAAIHLPDGPVNIGLVDGATYDRYYPHLQGFLQALDDSKLQWNEVASTNTALPEERSKVVQILRENPEINVLWGGSNMATEVVIDAVREIGWGDRVAIFGILDLSGDHAQMLLAPDNPLQSIIDQSGVQIGYRAVKTAIDILRDGGEGHEYEFYSIQHRLLTQSDKETVRQLLTEADSIGGAAE